MKPETRAPSKLAIHQHRYPVQPQSRATEPKDREIANPLDAHQSQGIASCKCQAPSWRSMSTSNPIVGSIGLFRHNWQRRKTARVHITGILKPNGSLLGLQWAITSTPSSLALRAYGGGELLRLLLDHPNAGSIQAVSRSHAGKPLHTAHPALRGFLELTFQGEADWGALARSEHPVVFSAQPHGDLGPPPSDAGGGVRDAGIAERLILVDLSGISDSVMPMPSTKPMEAPTQRRSASGSFVYGCPEAIARPSAMLRASPIRLPSPRPSTGPPALGWTCVGFVAVSAATGLRVPGSSPRPAPTIPSGPRTSGPTRCSATSISLRWRSCSEQGVADLHYRLRAQSRAHGAGDLRLRPVRAAEGFEVTALRARYQGFYADAPFGSFRGRITPRVAAVYEQ